jgi:hypothetical protein
MEEGEPERLSVNFANAIKNLNFDLFSSPIDAYLRDRRKERERERERRRVRAD